MADCWLNPKCFSCTCKGFKHHSICSHVVVAHCVLECYSIDRLVARIREPWGAGRRRKALGRSRCQPESDSEPESDSDAEEQNLLKC